MSGRRQAHSDEELLLELLQRLDERSCLPIRLLDELVAGTLPAVADAAGVQAHLKGCLSCLETFSRLQSLREGHPPTDAREKATRAPEPRVRLVGDSPSVRALRQQLIRLAGLDRGPRLAPPVLVTGEIGTGKGVVAWEIHALSRRATGPFIEIGCAGPLATRLEVELFGRDRGTVPDNPAATSGLFEAADGGTLFLDVIDAMPLDAQLKLLEVLEQGSVRRLGRFETSPLDVRIIAATHVDLNDAVRRGAFHADLLHRLKAATLALPPLRDRPDDIVPLARYFVGRFAQHHGGPVRLTDDAEERLRRYRWPGNIRELSNVIERAANRRAREEIGAEELGLPIATL